jgi:hypothetical protein
MTKAVLVTCNHEKNQKPNQQAIQLRGFFMGAWRFTDSILHTNPIAAPDALALPSLIGTLLPLPWLILVHWRGGLPNHSLSSPQ